MNRALGLLVFAGLLLAAFLALGLSGGRRAQGNDAETLRIPLPTNPPSLDPVSIGDTASDGVAKRIFNGLVRLDPDLNVVPDLAEKWEVSPDGKTYTFRLREGVLFHHGRTVKARDAVWSLDRLADPAVSRKLELVEEIEGVPERLELFRKSGGKDWKPAPLAGLSAPDDRTVVIRLRRPWVPFLSLMAMSPASVLPSEEVARLGPDFARLPVGTGPFRLVEWQDNDHLSLVRFDDYFAGTPRLAAVRYRIIKEPIVRLQCYLQGELDVTDVPLGKLGQVAGMADHRTWPMLATTYLCVAMTREPLGKNVHLRRALNYAVDRRRLCRDILEGRAVPAKGILPPGMPGYDPALVGYSFDPAAARRELELAGFPEGRGLATIPIYYRADPDGKRLILELQQQFRRAGIEIEPRAVEWGLLLDLTVKDPPPLSRFSWIADYPDPENFLFVLFHSSRTGDSNRSHYGSAEADRLIDAARALPAGTERLSAYARTEQHIVDEAPWVFLYHSSVHLLVKPNVKGLAFTALDPGVELPQADFVKVWKE